MKKNIPLFTLIFFSLFFSNTFSQTPDKIHVPGNGAGSAVLVNNPPVVRDTAVVTPENTSIIVCLPIKDLDAGEIFSASICGSSNGNATISVTGNQACVLFLPSNNFVGTANVCLVVCDNGTPVLCDTAHITITVTKVNYPPHVSDTTLSANENMSITTCKTISDLDNGETFSATLCGVTNGTATVTVTGNQLCMTFLPAENYYGTGGDVCVVVCDNGIPVLCDTVHFLITVPKEALDVPDAFSPNEDGVNDYFVIPGVENYPKSVITIFNRWGNLLYEASPYKNDWDGSTKHGIVVNKEKLPTGTYFMILDLKEDGITPFKKYIYLRR